MFEELRQTKTNKKKTVCQNSWLFFAKLLIILAELCPQTSTIINFFHARTISKCELQGNTTNPHRGGLAAQTLWLPPWELKSGIEPEIRLALWQEAGASQDRLSQVRPKRLKILGGGTRRQAQQRGSDISQGWLPVPGGKKLDRQNGVFIGLCSLSHSDQIQVLHGERQWLGHVKTSFLVSGNIGFWTGGWRLSEGYQEETKLGLRLEINHGCGRWRGGSAVLFRS